MTDTSTPLTPAVFHILLALANEERHGYEIMKQVKQDSHGRVKMGNGTLYGTIKRLLADHRIAEAGDKEDSDHERRKYYRLTPLGKTLLDAEMQRYVETAQVILHRQLLPDAAAIPQGL